MKTNKKSLGRPKSDNPADQRLPHIRVTKEQLDKYRRKAIEKDKTLSAWVKDTLDSAVS